MQGCAFSVTIRPSASDSIILGVSRGMWTIRPGAGKGMRVCVCVRKREEKRGKEREMEREKGDGRGGGTRRWLFDRVRESLESFTMDCDGPG